MRDLPIAAVGDVMCPADVDIGLYTGNVSVTSTGRTCAYWKDLTSRYDESSAADENYCRNFRHMDQVFPWCETTEGKVDFCIETICKGKHFCRPLKLYGYEDNHYICKGNQILYVIVLECVLTLKAPNKNCNRRHFMLFFFTFIFQRK